MPGEKDRGAAAGDGSCQQPREELGRDTGDDWRRGADEASRGDGEHLGGCSRHWDPQPWSNLKQGDKGKARTRDLLA